MVTVKKWGIEGDFLSANLEVAGYPKEIAAKLKLSTEEMRTTEVLPDWVRSDAKRALIQVLLDYESGKVKIGAKRVIAWG